MYCPPKKFRAGNDILFSLGFYLGRERIELRVYLHLELVELPLRFVAACRVVLLNPAQRVDDPDNSGNQYHQQPDTDAGVRVDLTRRLFEIRRSVRHLVWQ